MIIRSLFNTSFTIAFLKPIHRSLQIASPRRSLMEFFDDPKKWGETSILSGRPWREDELRLKSNTDLHNLWYVLLKERNMLMTMEEEHNRCLERMPNPERFEKVEESMENILRVVEERNRVEAELEQGEWVGPTVVDAVDPLGRATKQLTREHVQPRVADLSANADELMWGSKTIELLRLEREKKMQRARKLAREKRANDRREHWRRLDYLNSDNAVTSTGR